MNKKSRISFIERLAAQLRVIPDLTSTSATGRVNSLNPNAESGELPIINLHRSPPPEQWNSWKEYDANAWPNPVEREYMIVPTTCFNCESACGLLGYVDKHSGKVQKFEGNEYHPGSRGRNCAKGPATINQINDTDRILYPLKRVGKRGEGKWRRVTWEEALTEIAGRIQKAIQEERNNEIVYHVGRPGHEGYMDLSLIHI